MDDSIRSDGLPVTISAQWPRPCVCLVRLAGELDVATATPLVGFLRDHTIRNPTHLVLDLASVRFLASAGVGVIMSAMRNADGIRGRLHLIGVTDNPVVARVLDLTGVRPHLDVHDSLGHLLAHLDRDRQRVEPSAARSGVASRGDQHDAVLAINEGCDNSVRQAWLRDGPGERRHGVRGVRRDRGGPLG